jgi:hypothetical protein
MVTEFTMCTKVNGIWRIDASCAAQPTAKSDAADPSTATTMP